MTPAQILKEAQEAAVAAFHAAKPVPMVVGQAESLFSNRIVPGTEEFVADGVCGFAWTVIRPARGPFVKFLKEQDIGSKNYEGGWYVSSYDLAPGTGHSQSMQRKEAAVRAAVAVLNKHGINCYTYSRMD